VAGADCQLTSPGEYAEPIQAAELLPPVLLAAGVESWRILFLLLLFVFLLI
jgi:hypothetical protein